MGKEEILSFLKQFKRQNKNRYQIAKIGIFGSAARDEMSEASDIDVVVQLEKPDMFSIIGIKQDLEDQFHRPVDIVRYRSRMNTFLKRRLDKEAIYV